MHNTCDEMFLRFHARRGINGCCLIDPSRVFQRVFCSKIGSNTTKKEPLTVWITDHLDHPQHIFVNIGTREDAVNLNDIYSVLKDIEQKLWLASHFEFGHARSSEKRRTRFFASVAGRRR